MNKLMIDLCAGTMVAAASFCAAQATVAAVGPAAGKAPGVRLTDDRFASFPHYGGDDLGLTITPQGVARFRIWSPEAEQVRLRLYSRGRGGVPLTTIDMDRAEQGTWTAAVDPVPTGLYYTFQVLHDGRWLAETPGVW
ncbi:MAG: hypothetical protein K2O33_06860, partial [Muribaculaceae bacterium]|nr:hypothetical protein [Muribaculaceae bacterium]